jgi:hypothetical protein
LSRTRAHSCFKDENSFQSAISGRVLQEFYTAGVLPHIPAISAAVQNDSNTTSSIGSCRSNMFRKRKHVGLIKSSKSSKSSKSNNSEYNNIDNAFFIHPLQYQYVLDESLF